MNRARRRRVLLACLGPLLLCLALAAAEGILRAVGAGHPTAFFLPDVLNGRPVWRDNPLATSVEFGAHLARAPAPFRVPREKTPDTLRVFVLGESAAAGDPEPAFSFSRLLQARVEAGDPPSRIEVINPSITAVNSHVLRRMMKEIHRLEPDVVVLYIGHNEVVGPYGPASLFGRFTPSRADIALRTLVRRSRLAQTLDPLLAGARTPAAWQGMAMFQDERIAVDDPRLETVYRQFTRNLSDMVRLARGAGAHVLLCTVASSLRDCAPFASLSNPNASHPAAPTPSPESLARAVQQNPASAELRHRLGLALEASDPDAAREAFRAARDRDALRFRADSRIVQITRDVAAAFPHDVTLLDLEQTIAHLPFARQDGLFLDHVHFSYEGNRFVAAQIFDALQKLQPDLAGPKRATDDAVNERLAWNEWSEWRIVREMTRRREKPPFTLQWNHEADLHLWSERLAQCATRIASAAPALHASFRRALELRPLDEFVLQAFGEFLMDRGDCAAAVEPLSHAMEQVPHRMETRFRLAVALAGNGQAQAAEDLLLRAFPKPAERATALEAIGVELGERGLTAQAVDVLQRAHELAPGDAALLNAWGGALLIAGRNEEATQSLRDALALDPNLAEAHNNLGSALAQAGRTEEALPHFREAARLSPALASARRNTLRAAHVTARAMAEAGHLPAAAERLKEAVAVDPHFVPALADLAVLYCTTELATPGQPDAALQWAEAAMRASAPTDPRGHLALCAALDFAGRCAEATDMAHAAMARVPPAEKVVWRRYLQQLRRAAVTRAGGALEPGPPLLFPPE